MIYDGTRSVEGGTGWYLVVLGQYRAVRFEISCYWVSMKRNWLIHDNTGVSRRQYRLGVGGAGSVWSGTDWYLVVLCHYNLVPLGIK